MGQTIESVGAILMMQVEPTCHFCHRPVIYVTAKWGDVNDPSSAICRYKCVPCRSEQDFNTRGRCIRWEFQVGKKYRLMFWTDPVQFSVILLADENLAPNSIEKCLLQLNTLPTNLTPQNTNEERVKLFITFS